MLDETKSCTPQELVALCAMPRLHERQFRRALKELHKRKEVMTGPLEMACLRGILEGPVDLMMLGVITKIPWNCRDEKQNARYMASI